jgi:hydroxymethylbilane synthase
MKRTLVIATRGSDLALWQARFVMERLQAAGQTCELNVIKTQGDRIQHLSLDKLEGKGFFTREIEDALLDGTADLAVHSHKDLPTESHPDLFISAVSDREDPSELLLIRPEAVDPARAFSLRNGAVVGTSSARRKSQLLAYRGDLSLQDLRGNVPTRIRKLREGQYDAILLAAAGVERLGLDLSGLHASRLDPATFVPAPAQGVLAIQIRRTDEELARLLSVIHHPSTARTTAIERSVLNLFQGGCHMPVGAFATYREEEELYTLCVARSETWDQLPAGVYLTARDPDRMAETAVNKLHSLRPCPVFVSRNRKKDDYLVKVLEANGYAVTAEALIDIVPVAFPAVPQTDWIFFSSKHAVNFFFSQQPAIGSQRFGCIGKSTAEALRRHGRTADFIGYSTDTRLTGKQFASRVGSGTVLFPQAKGSLRTVQNGFVKKGQVTDLAVYETKASGTAGQLSPDRFGVLVFTSPSNAEAFLRDHRIDAAQRVVAMGDATGHVLRKSGVKRLWFPDDFNDAALARAVFTCTSGND